VVFEGGSGKKSFYVLWIDSKWGGMDGVGFGSIPCEKNFLDIIYFAIFVY